MFVIITIGKSAALAFDRYEIFVNPPLFALFVIRFDCVYPLKIFLCNLFIKIDRHLLDIVQTTNYASLS